MEAGRLVTGSSPEPADDSPGTEPAAPIGRQRRQRSLRESLGAIVLGFEVLVVFLGALVLFGLKSLPAPVALGGGAALVVLMIVAIALLRYPIGVILGWLIQLIVVAAGFLVPAFFIVGAIFTAMWTYCMITASRLERTTDRTENP